VKRLARSEKSVFSVAHGAASTQMRGGDGVVTGVWLCRLRKCGALMRAQTLAVIQKPKFFERVQAHVTVCADAPDAALLLIGVEFKKTIAQIAFCRRTNDRISPRFCHSLNLVLVQMCGVNKVIVRPDRTMIQQPFHGAFSQIFYRLTHFFELFGHVDVKRYFCRNLCREPDDVFWFYRP